MVRSHLLGLAGALALIAAGTEAAPRAVASQPQTIQFTSTAPSGVDWYTSKTFFGYQYVAEATASSGLPVEYSIAPESADVCSIVPADVYGGSGAAISFDGGGTCTVLADQPGNGDYLPAPQATQSFQIDRVRTFIERVRARKGLPGSTPATFFATLRTWQFIDSHSVSPQPFPGQVITFSVAGRPVCSGTTGSDGVATCRAVLRRSELTRLRFTATYAGTDDYLPISGSAFFL